MTGHCARRRGSLCSVTVTKPHEAVHRPPASPTYHFVTVTELASEGDSGRNRCRWCQRPLTGRPGPGRPREYCRQTCRQRDYEARTRAAERGLDESEIIVGRGRLDALHDKLWILACAVEDVDGDLRRSADAADVRAALDWLLEAARPLIADLDR